MADAQHVLLAAVSRSFLALPENLMSSRAESPPLSSLEEWDEDLRRRYPTPAQASGADASGTAARLAAGSVDQRTASDFRDYAAASDRVREFYRLNHRHQTLEFTKARRAEYLPRERRRMGIWEALEFLNTLVDDSDPDTDLSQIEHCLQTAEAIRRDGHPRWFVLTGLIHDLGKVLCLFGEPQWAVVGDTFPLGCRFSEKIVYAEFFAENPDSHVPGYQTPCGIYTEGCGLDRVLLSWGHDEYLYHVVRDYLPPQGLAMIRYHSFYAAHAEGEYTWLMNDHDREMLRWVRAFNPYDLYTKSHTRPDVAALRPYYDKLIAEYFPPVLAW
jgi:inositol oxygenase